MRLFERDYHSVLLLTVCGQLKDAVSKARRVLCHKLVNSLVRTVSYVNWAPSVTQLTLTYNNWCWRRIAVLEIPTECMDVGRELLLTRPQGLHFKLRTLILDILFLSWNFWCFNRGSKPFSCNEWNTKYILTVIFSESRPMSTRTTGVKRWDHTTFRWVSPCLLLHSAHYCGCVF